MFGKVILFVLESFLLQPKFSIQTRRRAPMMQSVTDASLDAPVPIVETPLFPFSPNDYRFYNGGQGSTVFGSWDGQTNNSNRPRPASWRDVTVASTSPASPHHSTVRHDTHGPGEVKRGGVHSFVTKSRLDGSSSDRKLLWKVIDNTLELVDTSPTTTIRHGFLRIHFPSLEGDVSIVDVEEDESPSVCIFARGDPKLVYRVTLPHPSKTRTITDMRGTVGESILANFTPASIAKHVRCIELQKGGSQITSLLALDPSRAAVGFEDGNLVLVNLESFETNDKIPLEEELKEATGVTSWISGLIRTKSPAPSPRDSILAIQSFHRNDDALVLVAFGGDGRLRFWDVSERTLIHTFALFDDEVMSTDSLTTTSTLRIRKTSTQILCAVLFSGSVYVVEAPLDNFSPPSRELDCALLTCDAVPTHTLLDPRTASMRSQGAAGGRGDAVDMRWIGHIENNSPANTLCLAFPTDTLFYSPEVTVEQGRWQRCLSPSYSVIPAPGDINEGEDVHEFFVSYILKAYPTQIVCDVASSVLVHHQLLPLTGSSEMQLRTALKLIVHAQIAAELEQTGAGADGEEAVEDFETECRKWEEFLEHLHQAHMQSHQVIGLSSLSDVERSSAASYASMAPSSPRFEPDSPSTALGGGASGRSSLLGPTELLLVRTGGVSSLRVCDGGEWVASMAMERQPAIVESALEDHDLAAVVGCAVLVANNVDPAMMEAFRQDVAHVDVVEAARPIVHALSSSPSASTGDFLLPDHVKNALQSTADPVAAMLRLLTLMESETDLSSGGIGKHNLSRRPRSYGSTLVLDRARLAASSGVSGHLLHCYASSCLSEILSARVWLMEHVLLFLFYLTVAKGHSGLKLKHQRDLHTEVFPRTVALFQQLCVLEYLSRQVPRSLSPLADLVRGGVHNRASEADASMTMSRLDLSGINNTAIGGTGAHQSLLGQGPSQFYEFDGRGVTTDAVGSGSCVPLLWRALLSLPSSANPALADTSALISPTSTVGQHPNNPQFSLGFSLMSLVSGLHAVPGWLTSLTTSLLWELAECGQYLALQSSLSFLTSDGHARDTTLCYLRGECHITHGQFLKAKKWFVATLHGVASSQSSGTGNHLFVLGDNAGSGAPSGDVQATSAVGAEKTNATRPLPTLLGLAPPDEVLQAPVDAIADAVDDHNRAATLEQCRSDVTSYQYLRQVSTMFEKCGRHDIALDVAYQALPYLQSWVAASIFLSTRPDDPPEETPTIEEHPEWSSFWSTVFRLCLVLGRFDDAYVAMLSVRNHRSVTGEGDAAVDGNNTTVGPNQSRRFVTSSVAFGQRDCLRRFVVAMYEAGELERLISYPYIGIVGEVETVLLRKAETCNVFNTPNFYHILYSFHMHRSNHNQAAKTMYLLAQRIGHESHSTGTNVTKQLAGQRDSYLACLNALALVDPKYAWFVLPLPKEHIHKRKRAAKGTADEETPADSDSLSVVRLEDVRREYLICSVWKRLAEKVPSPSLSWQSHSEDEIVAMLVSESAGLFDEAISVSRLSNASADLTVVFKALTLQCVKSIRQRHVAKLQGAKSGDVYHVSHSGIDSMEDDVWEMLQSYLNTYDTASTNYRYHQIVAEQILSCDSAIKLPQWLVDSFRYAGKHPEALLRTYMKHGLFLDAAKFARLMIMDARHDISSELERQAGWRVVSYLPYRLLGVLIEHLKAGKRTDESEKLVEEIEMYWKMLTDIPYTTSAIAG